MPSFTDVAQSIAQALVDGRWSDAHGLLTPELQKELPPVELSRRFVAMYQGYAPDDKAETIDFNPEFCGTDWPNKQTADLGWVYVGILGGEFVEGSPAMLRAMRVHSNFAEYVPLSILLVALVEVGGTGAWAVHGLGLLLLAGRLSHAYGVSQTKEVFAFRVAGMAMTFTTILCASLILLYEFAWPRVA